VTTLPPGVLIRHLLKGEKGVMTLPDRRVISSPQRFKKKHGLDVEQSQKKPCQHLSHFFPNYLPEKNHGVPSQNFEKKNVYMKKVTRLPDLTVSF
jgi:hypothetical protein